MMITERMICGLMTEAVNELSMTIAAVDHMDPRDDRTKRFVDTLMDLVEAAQEARDQHVGHLDA